ncbi:MAG TPA: hypothetical protein VMT10_11390 [Solirubrobacteraceae bacterium]|nr:hypothetical protein [Solirubrobacteraceae bacterium]
MQAAFGIVLFVVVAGAAVVAIVTFAGAGRAYSQIGRGGLSLRDGSDRPPGEPQSGAALSSAERTAELRQLLEARNLARMRNGKPALDVETELAALLRPAVDPALEAEIRDLVIARNARRVRKGHAPLDVEAEVARQVAELGG